MEQVNQLKQMREAAQQRMNVSREGIKQQLLALENSADAKLVKSLGTLIADLELLAAPAVQAAAPSVQSAPIETPSVENVAENALADALGTPAPAQVAAPTIAKADSLSALTEQLRGTMATNS